MEADIELMRLEGVVGTDLRSIAMAIGSRTSWQGSSRFHNKTKKSVINDKWQRSLLRGLKAVAVSKLGLAARQVSDYAL